ncbi:MAG: endonuclease III [Candidatus Promineofilum sp.]|nr:endonuclease III [Promineifilum sp.]
MSELPTPAYVTEVIARLRRAHPDAHCALDYETPLQLLAAVILSAQCTDERVNLTTPALFARYPTAEALAAADPAELEAIVRPTGFYRNKARFLRQAAARLLAEYGGEVPPQMDALLSLPGVARKTANVVRGEIYGLADGITVDTHVKRLSARLGLTTKTDPVKVERDLMAVIPRESWIEIAHLLIWHGRRVCTARKPNCPACPLNDICPSSVVSWSVVSSRLELSTPTTPATDN